MPLSVVIPLADAARWPLPAACSLTAAGHQVVVVCPQPPPADADGAPGSAPAQQTPAQRTPAQQKGLQNVEWLQAPLSRGGQIAAGVSRCRYPLVWVLHADSAAIEAAQAYLQDLDSRVLQNNPRACVWGRFDIRIAGVRWVAWWMNQRSRWTRICTGDQGMFFSTAALAAIDGFPPQPLMEDIEVSKRLRRVLPKAFRAPRVFIHSDGGRWLRRGWLRTVLSMWWFRIRYFAGVSPQRLYREYYGRADG